MVSSDEHDENAAAGSRVHRTVTETSDDDTAMRNTASTSGGDYAAVVVEAVRAINHGIFPERIAQGSSGSYF
uniref:Uncharacterized protein n=1 Tax=Ditylenchus dipsaci TaxID=166011 RepID=A0A915ERB1_9BILA